MKNIFSIINILLLITIIILLITLINNKCINNRIKNNKVDIINTLYRQCARWAMASIQDNSEIIKVLHANYATGYLWAIKDITSSEEFKQIIGEDLMILEEKIISIQDNSSKLLVDKCPNLVNLSDPILLKAIYLKTFEESLLIH